MIPRGPEDKLKRQIKFARATARSSAINFCLADWASGEPRILCRGDGANQLKSQEEHDSNKTISPAQDPWSRRLSKYNQACQMSVLHTNPDWQPCKRRGLLLDLETNRGISTANDRTPWPSPLRSQQSFEIDSNHQPDRLSLSADQLMFRVAINPSPGRIPAHTDLPMIERNAAS